MKRITTTPVLLLISALLIFTQCKKKIEEPQLPPETTTGAMTFVCKVNGKVFVPRDGRGKPGLFVQYVNLGTGPGGGWYLNIPAVDWKPADIPAVSITTDSLIVNEGSTYQFKFRKKGFPGAFYSNGPQYNATDNNSGELKIKKFDNVNRIISGTFFFTGTDNSTGQTVSITEGRFDIRY